jgi:hypothetical protein
LDFEAPYWPQRQRIKCQIDKDEIVRIEYWIFSFDDENTIARNNWYKWLWSWLLHNFVTVVVDCNFRFSNGAYGLFLCYWYNECDDDVIVTFDNDENRKMCDVK